MRDGSSIEGASTPDSSAKISVIVPAYNSGSFLRTCINSIRTQDYENLEIVVVDDCSSDGTAEILSDFAALDPRVKAVSGPENLGIHGARRLGFIHATGDFIGYVDHDDFIERKMFSTLHKRLVETGASIAICSVSTIINGRPGARKVAFRSADVLSNDILPRFCRLELGSGVLWNKLYVRDVIEPSALMDLERSIDGSEDYIINFGAFARASSVALCPDNLYNYVLHGKNVSRDSDVWKNFARVLRAYVVCLEACGRENPANGTLIDDLYLKQLHFPAYNVNNAAPSNAVREHLTESLRRLGEVRPETIYSILHSRPHRQSRLRRALRRFHR